jgi:arginine utilization protein RocB
LVDREGSVSGAPPVALRLRDLKSRYDVQTAAEAEIELNLITTGRTLVETLEVLRSEISVAIEECRRAMSSLGEWSGRRALPRLRPALVLTHAELVARARGVLAGQPLRVEADAWARTREWIPALAGDARLAGPLVVISLLPPYYPHAAPRTGGLADRLRPLLQRRGVPLRDRYPYISDAAYLAWRGDDDSEIGPHMPALGRGYTLPIEAARALDLEVVSLGPWGRDAHGLYERVHAPYAFGILPGLIAEAAVEALRA